MADRKHLYLSEYIRMKERFPLESDDIAQIKEFAKSEEGYIKMLKEENALLEQKNADLQTKLAHLREEVELLADERGETRTMIREELNRCIPVIIERVVHQLGVKLDPSKGQATDNGSGGDGRPMEGRTHMSSVLGSVADGVPLGCSVSLGPVESTNKDNKLCTRQTRSITVSVPSTSTDGLVTTSPLNPSFEKIKDSLVLENVFGNEPGLDLLDTRSTLFSEMEILAVDHPQLCDPHNPSNVIDDLKDLQVKMDAELKNRELAIRELEMEDDDF